MTQQINQNCGPFRLSNRHGVTRVSREPIGPTKTNGPRLGLPGWLFGHQTTITPSMWIPSVGLERKAMGLTGTSRPVVEPTKVRDGGRDSKAGSGPRRGKGRRKRRQQRYAEAYARQDAQVAKIRKRDRERAKIAAAREMSARVQVARQIKSGNVASLISNPAMEVTS